VTWLLATAVLVAGALVALALCIHAQLRAMSIAYDQMVGTLARTDARVSRTSAGRPRRTG